MSSLKARRLHGYRAKANCKRHKHPKKKYKTLHKLRMSKAKRLAAWK